MISCKKGFTLIEMLIVVVIIGILAAALIPRLQSVQTKARDTTRKTDLRTIYTANEVYLADYSRYAQAGACSLNTECGVYSADGANWFTELNGILSSTPRDPINTRAMNPAGVGGTGNYEYAYSNVFTRSGAPRNTYDLQTILESPSDPDRCEIKRYKRYLYPNGLSEPRCTPGGHMSDYYGPHVNQIYEFSPDSNSF